MSETDTYLIMPNGMRVKRILIDSEKKIQNDKQRNGIGISTKVNKDQDKYWNTEESKSISRVKTFEVDLNKEKDSKPKRTHSSLMQNPDTHQSPVAINENNKWSQKNISTQNVLRSKNTPKSIEIPNSITVGKYIQFKNTRKLYKVIDRDQNNLVVQDANHKVITLKFEKNIKDLILIVSDLHIGVLKQETKGIDTIKEKLLNAPIKYSIEIIKATGLKPLHYGLMKLYLVPSILNKQEWEVWKLRLRKEMEGSSPKKSVQVKEIVKSNHMLIRPQDFVVRVHTFFCSNKGHILQSIQAEILTKTLDGKNISSITIPAGYCRQCNRYYILSSIFEDNVMQLKHALCDFVKENDLSSYLKNQRLNSHEFASQSILNKCGYSVSCKNQLSDSERIQLLNSIIDKEVLSREEVKSFLNWLIRFHSSNLTMNGALKEWKSDLLGIASCKNSNVVLVNRIYT